MKKQVYFYSLTLKDLTLKTLIIILRFILLSVLFVLIYFVIWYFIYIIGNEDIIGWGTIICLVIGWKILEHYEDCVDADRFHRACNGENIRISYRYKMNFLLKILLTPIAIPLKISAFVCDFITDYIYKENVTEKDISNNTKPNNTINTKIKTVEEIEKDLKEYERKYKSNNNTTTYDYSDFEEEYYCEICLKRITEEDYELYDCMCEECFFEKEDYNNMKK